ncbi:MAG TPA: S41 family peptidase [Bryobacteraceae bacterium]|nr:S41 family peptidase [Bryobacteraceae bacterium]
MSRRGSIIIPLIAVCTCGPIFAQLTAKQKAENLESFEVVWSTVRDRHPDPNLNGLNWLAIHDATRPAIEKARSMNEVRGILTGMLAKLNSSHYSIIPGDLYNQIDSPDAGPGDSGITPVIIGGKAVVGSVAPDSPAAQAGLRPGMVLDAINGAKIDSTIQGLNALKDQESHRIVEQSVTRKLDGPAGKPVAIDVIDEQGRPKHLELDPASPKGELVQFANLPAMRVFFESRALPDSVGYIRFNEFLDPASLMPKFEEALKGFTKAPGIILDLRGNPGGISLMAMGIAGFFVDEDGKKLGEMKMRETTLKFVIFPRPETYSGPLAILVDEGSASTSEIFAGGMQDLKRARIFGVRTAGAALPSDIIRLPNGDGFQYPQASYTSVSGKVLEGAGVTPDVLVEQTREGLLAGRDLVIEAADSWIRSTRR